MLIFVERGGEADSLAPGKSLNWGTDALVVSANRNKVIRVTVSLASEENDQFLYNTGKASERRRNGDIKHNC